MDSEKLMVEDLTRKIKIQAEEISAKNKRIKELEGMIINCVCLEERNKSWKTRAENHKTALTRAEANTATLNTNFVIGSQTASSADAVNPGASRKDFDTITRENIELKEALELIVPMQLGGKDFVVKNRELNELVATLQGDILQRERNISELEDRLKEYAATINNLQEQNIAAQHFAEGLLEINRELKNIQRNTSHQVPDLDQTNEELGDDQSPSARDIRNDEREKKLLRMMGTVSRNVTAVVNELVQANENRAKTESVLIELERQLSNYRNERKAMYLKQRKSAEKISLLNRTIESLRVQVAKKDAMIAQMEDLNTPRSFQDANFGRYIGSGTSRRSAQNTSDRNYHDFTLPRRFGSSFINDLNRQLPMIMTDGNDVNQGGDDVNQEDNQSSSSSNLIECLFCPKSYPMNSIEEHLKECRESMNG